MLKVGRKFEFYRLKMILYQKTNKLNTNMINSANQMGNRQFAYLEKVRIKSGVSAQVLIMVMHWNVNVQFKNMFKLQMMLMIILQNQIMPLKFFQKKG